ncbi:hypothetical protein E2C01_032738 [Portunus trituberculatus]|uniref:Uncharacterized protein n=1 Tax=Portunus trituberculatus TaxID=210409 RepID=A0A5B7EWP9_PORTR|nr:hypothetical protein [Portunus trituberculatus]
MWYPVQSVKFHMLYEKTSVRLEDGDHLVLPTHVPWKQSTTTFKYNLLPGKKAACRCRAIVRTPGKDENTDKSNKSNLTKLEQQRPCVVAAPAPSSARREKKLAVVAKLQTGEEEVVEQMSYCIQ